MKELKFIEGALPKGFKSDFESFLFNGSTHRKLQAEKGWISFCLVQEIEKKILASVYFYIEGSIAYSPKRAPFGSVEFSEKLQPKDLFEFLHQVENCLRNKNINQIQIKNPPAAYRHYTSAVLEVLLLNLGYRTVRAEINMSLSVNDIAFEKKIDVWELRKWKQSKKADLSFMKIPIRSVKEVYAFIHTCRKERQQSLSMTMMELQETVDACPDAFLLFGVYQKKILTAASVSIRVSKRIVYNFYSAHASKFDSLSPVVCLISGMYGWCQLQNIELLDLGTSALGDSPNFGLLDFKRRLGGTTSAKLTFEKALT